MSAGEMSEVRDDRICERGRMEIERGRKGERQM
jgi:hypothetical protein